MQSANSFPKVELKEGNDTEASGSQTHMKREAK